MGVPEGLAGLPRCKLLMKHKSFVLCLHIYLILSIPACKVSSHFNGMNLIWNCCEVSKVCTRSKDSVRSPLNAAIITVRGQMFFTQCTTGIPWDDDWQRNSPKNGNRIQFPISHDCWGEAMLPIRDVESLKNDAFVSRAGCWKQEKQNGPAASHAQDMYAINL